MINMNGAAQIHYRDQPLFHLRLESSPTDVEPKLFAPFRASRPSDRTHSQLHRLKRELPPQEYASLKGALWAFRKNQADLETPEQDLLKRVFAYAPELEQADAYREQLTAIFEEALSKEEATKKLQDWQQQVRASGLRCYERFLKTLDTWREEITNYFLNRHNSGFVEGLNNKIRVIQRRAYGLRDEEYLRLKVLSCMLPEL